MTEIFPSSDTNRPGVRLSKSIAFELMSERLLASTTSLYISLLTIGLELFTTTSESNFVSGCNRTSPKSTDPIIFRSVIYLI